MTLPFETWIREHSPTPEASVAFNEAVSTYKTGAYRAALVFSYVGMGPMPSSPALVRDLP